MNKIGGGSLPAAIWHDVMMTTIRGSSNESNKIDDIGSLIEDSFLSSDSPTDSLDSLLNSI